MRSASAADRDMLLSVRAGSKLDKGICHSDPPMLPVLKSCRILIR